MFRIGEKQTLVVEKMVPMGVYLKERTLETEEKEESEGKDAEHVLLPVRRCRRARQQATRSRCSFIRIRKTV